MQQPIPPLDSAYFTRYDGLHRELVAHATADADLARGKQLLQSATKAEASTAHAEKKNHIALESHRKKVDKYSGQGLFDKSLFHPEVWFCGGVDARLERNKAKVEKETAEEEKLQLGDKTLLAQIEALKGRVAHLNLLSRNKAELTKEVTGMFESAVASMPTPLLYSLQTEASSFRANVEFERTNTAIMKQVKQLCAKARSHYYNALRALDDAQSTNRNAQMNNIIGGRSRGMEMMEQMQDARRNNLMRRAEQEARSGGERLGQAFSMVPEAARTRYPQLCEGLGQVSVPSVEQMGLGSVMMQAFGGDIVDAMVDMRAAEKIREGMGAVGDCERIAAQQEELVNKLLAVMQRDGDGASTQLQAKLGQIYTEKQRIFSMQRQSAGMMAPAGAPVMVQGSMVDNRWNPNDASSRAHAAAVLMQNAARAGIQPAAGTVPYMPGAPGQLPVAIPVAMPVAMPVAAVPMQMQMPMPPADPSGAAQAQLAQAQIAQDLASVNSTVAPTDASGVARAMASANIGY